MKLAHLFLLAGFVCLSYLAGAQNKPAPVFSTKEGAIKGYDPVAYFTEKKPVKGTDKYKFTWNGAVWKFADQKNLDTFKAAPEKYAPQFGGYCAFGLAQNYAVKIETDCWDIVDGKLYLNYNKAVQKDWRAKQAEFIKTAVVNWPKVLKGEK